MVAYVTVCVMDRVTLRMTRKVNYVIDASVITKIYGGLVIVAAHLACTEKAGVQFSVPPPIFRK